MIDVYAACRMVVDLASGEYCNEPAVEWVDDTWPMCEEHRAKW